MKYLLVIIFLSITLLASSGLKKEVISWQELRAQQQADSATYEAVRILDSLRTVKHLK